VNPTASLVNASLLSLLATNATAQVYSDSFNYPNGTTVPGWTQQRGIWQVQNGRISSTSGGTWAYITKDNLSATRCVIDGEFFFVGAGVQFAGLTSRHPGGNVDTNLLMVKIQNNGAAADFDRVFAYERGVALGAYYADIPGGTLAAYCRMVTLGNEFWIETDADRVQAAEEAAELAEKACLVSRSLDTPVRLTLCVTPLAGAAAAAAR